MANYVVRSVAPANLQPAQFFQPGATRSGFPPSVTTFQNPSGSFVSMEGTGFAYVGETNVPTAGTVTAITLYAPDFTVQWAAFSDLSIPLVELYEVWLGTTPGDVFFLLLAGNDIVAGEDQSDILSGHDGDDTITAGNGDDVIEPGAGDDSIDGGDGTRDILSYANASLDPIVTKGLTADLSAPTITDPWGGTDSFTGIEGLRGTKFADTLTGDAGANRFEGLAGNDIIDGGAGQDQIRYVRDAQYGGTAGVTVNLATGTATDGFGNTDSFTGIEAVVGTNNQPTS
jgi:serralysin